MKAHALKFHPITSISSFGSYISTFSSFDGIQSSTNFQIFIHPMGSPSFIKFISSINLFSKGPNHTSKFILCN
jgi:hypothetical protein